MPERPPRVAGVRFRNAGKIFYFHAAGLRLEPGEYVVVETVRGPEIARVVIAPDQVVVDELPRDELKPILRLATEADIRRADELHRRAEELLPEARRLGEETGFPARIDHASFTLDGKRLTFSFTSEERLDYREFVRRAAQQFHARVEMHQMGARDRARLAGGYGICGRELCCASWLETFPSISIRMAKDQELPLNPQKISGLCGRLLCCLSYEDEGYREMRKSLPKIGQRCSTPTGEGKVVAINILKRQVTLLVDGQRIEVGDRDLGTVVRWDPSSKSAPPPPSLTREEAVARGLIEPGDEADEADAAEEDAVYEPGPGRGRLPGGGPRRIVPARPARREPLRPTTPAPEPPPPADLRRTRGAVPAPQQPASGPAGGGPPPAGRVFRRAASPGGTPPGAGQRPPTAQGPQPPASQPPQDGGRRRRRRGRGSRPEDSGAGD
ncbi:regulatory iron-sulfur-containing complex subunit RicT [Tepidiforma sp.]|uniref:PSP1 domain-containing protein n=1 Tax=Tepidiforma sp. TaxID=2682230 RepID=UPI002ADDA191|nr:regulatory iron-sulfur-containing complex subunit RicT [Tepidiforma sp.]